MRILIGLCLALVLVAATPSESSAQAVAQVITFEVAPGQVGDFLAVFAKGAPILQRHAPDAEAAIWQTVVGGPNTNRLTIVITHPSLEAWGATQPKIAADPAYR